MTKYVKLSGSGWSSLNKDKVFPVKKEDESYYHVETEVDFILVDKEQSSIWSGTIVEAPKTNDRPKLEVQIEQIDTELDALAAQIYANNPKWSLELGGNMFREMGLITPEYAYNLAQEFLDYKKSRREK